MLKYLPCLWQGNVHWMNSRPTSLVYKWWSILILQFSTLWPCFGLCHDVTNVIGKEEMEALNINPQLPPHLGLHTPKWECSCIPLSFLLKTSERKTLEDHTRLQYVAFENPLGISQLPVVHLITELLNGSPLPKKQCTVIQKDKVENTGTIRLSHSLLQINLKDSHSRVKET